MPSIARHHRPALDGTRWPLQAHTPRGRGREGVSGGPVLRDGHRRPEEPCTAGRLEGRRPPQGSAGRRAGPSRRVACATLLRTGGQLSWLRYSSVFVLHSKGATAFRRLVVCRVFPRRVEYRYVLFFKALRSSVVWVRVRDRLKPPPFVTCSFGALLRDTARLAFP
jgi:hypothetical protein